MKTSVLLFGAISTLSKVAVAQTCSPSLHFIVARGSLEPQSGGGLGFSAPIIASVLSQIPGSDSVGLEYPATLSNYQASEGAGVANLTKLLIDYTTACPNTKIALLGFSQGGQVVGDTLCGTSSALFAPTAPIDVKYTKNVIAAVTLGTPAHNVALFASAGNATNNAGFVRTDLAACDPYRGRFIEYCAADDLFCDAGQSIQVHVEEPLIYGNNATAYIVDRYFAAVGSSLPTTVATPTFPPFPTLPPNLFGGGGSRTSASSTSSALSSTLSSALVSVSSAPASGNSTLSTVVVTMTVQSYTTYCPAPTTITNGNMTQVVTTPGTVTITNCPCTITSVSTIGKVTTTPVYQNSTIPITKPATLSTAPSTVVPTSGAPQPTTTKPVTAGAARMAGGFQVAAGAVALAGLAVL